MMMVLAPTGMEETLLGEVKGRVFAKRRLEVARWMRGSREMELAEVEAPARQEKDK